MANYYTGQVKPEFVSNRNAFITSSSGTTGDLDISSSVKYDVCRLIITIVDTSKGMPLSKINNILENDNDIAEKELNQIDTIKLNLKMVKKTIDVLGGTLLIQSKEAKETTFIVILNQIIDNIKEQPIIKPLAKVLSNKKRVLLVEDNYKELEKIRRELKKIILKLFLQCMEKIASTSPIIMKSLIIYLLMMK